MIRDINTIKSNLEVASANKKFVDEVSSVVEDEFKSLDRGEAISFLLTILETSFKELKSGDSDDLRNFWTIINKFYKEVKPEQVV
jgi:hypothetical protein